jgi:hypothetical protein
MQILQDSIRDDTVSRANEWRVGPDAAGLGRLVQIARDRLGLKRRIAVPELRSGEVDRAQVNASRGSYTMREGQVSLSRWPTLTANHSSKCSIRAILASRAGSRPALALMLMAL